MVCIFTQTDNPGINNLSRWLCFYTITYIIFNFSHLCFVHRTQICRFIYDPRQWRPRWQQSVLLFYWEGAGSGEQRPHNLYPSGATVCGEDGVSVFLLLLASHCVPGLLYIVLPLLLLPLFRVSYNILWSYQSPLPPLQAPPLRYPSNRVFSSGLLLYIFWSVL